MVLMGEIVIVVPERFSIDRRFECEHPPVSHTAFLTVARSVRVRLNTARVSFSGYGSFSRTDSAADDAM
jgi:hypothetical protein